MASHPVFRVESLGPIRRGEVELRPLTLLIGKNNTGKTYMAQAIHACHKALQAGIGDSLPTLEPADLEALERCVNADPTPQPLAPPPGVIPILEQWLRARFQAASSCLPEQMHSVYGVPTLDWLDSWDSDRPATVSAYHHSGNGTPHLFGTSHKPPGTKISSFDLTSETAVAMRSRVFAEDRAPMLPGHDDGDDSRVGAGKRPSRAIFDPIWNQQLQELGFGSHSYYLPSSRSGLLAACADAIQARGQSEQDHFDPQRRPDASLSGVRLDMLSDLQAVFGSALRRDPRSGTSSSPIHKALTALDQAIDGTVVVESPVGSLPILMYHQGRRRIPLHTASAMVTDLAPLVLWTRELIAPGDLIIVDEPEAHLHPEANRQVARALVRLANAGVKVLCVTHSSTLIHQISNCMLAAEIPKEDEGYLEENLGFLPEDRISHTDIGVFRFMCSPTSATVDIAPVKIDPEWGISEEEYMEMALDLINQSADLGRASDS